MAAHLAHTVCLSVWSGTTPKRERERGTGTPSRTQETPCSRRYSRCASAPVHCRLITDTHAHAHAHAHAQQNIKAAPMLLGAVCGRRSVNAPWRSRGPAQLAGCLEEPGLCVCGQWRWLSSIRSYFGAWGTRFNLHLNAGLGQSRRSASEGGESRSVGKYAGVGRGIVGSVGWTVVLRFLGSACLAFYFFSLSGLVGQKHHQTDLALPRRGPVVNGGDGANPRAKVSAGICCPRHRCWRFPALCTSVVGRPLF